MVLGIKEVEALKHNGEHRNNRVLYVPFNGNVLTIPYDACHLLFSFEYFISILH